MIKAWPDRILESFQLIEAQTERLTQAFYDRLFQIAPETRSLFASDIERQRQHLAASLALIVRNLRFLDTIQGSLRDLGRAHARLGVRPQHYPVVRDAMLFALAHALGTAWTEQTKNDWARLLEIISTQMLAGSAESR